MSELMLLLRADIATFDSRQPGQPTYFSGLNSDYDGFPKKNLCTV